MVRAMIKISLPLLLAVACWACNGPIVVNNTSSSPPAGGMAQPSGAPQASAAAAGGGLTFKTPEGWVTETPSSGMRYAQYKLPGSGAEDASLVVFFFGVGQGGTIDDNFNRWAGQMRQPDGKPADKSKTEKLTVNGLNVTLLDVTGTYAGGDMMGGSNQEKPNSRMRAGVIETPKGSYYIKLTGPEKTVTRWDDAFMAFVKSAQLKS
jgi:hypothetical protein